MSCPVSVPILNALITVTTVQSFTETSLIAHPVCCGFFSTMPSSAQEIQQCSIDTRLLPVTSIPSVLATWRLSSITRLRTVTSSQRSRFSVQHIDACRTMFSKRTPRLSRAHTMKLGRESGGSPS